MVTVHHPITRYDIERVFPVLRQPKIPTMDKKLVIEAAIPGWHPLEWWEARGIHHLPPRTIEAQVDAIEECVKAGASVIHTHPRDPSDGLGRVHAPALLAEIMDRALERVDFITCHHTWTWDIEKSRAVDYVSYTDELLKRGKGNRYVQAALVMTEGQIHIRSPLHTARSVQEGVKWFEAHGIKPMFSTEAYAFSWLMEEVLNAGLAKSKPYWLSLQFGKHRDDQIFADPYSYLQVIINMGLVRSAVPDPDNFIGIHPGGRNWLPVAVQGIMFGAELVRVGLEDQFWLYPHRDDISQKASDTVEIVATIAKALGREIATVDEARKRLGIKRTS